MKKTVRNFLSVFLAASMALSPAANIFASEGADPADVQDVIVEDTVPQDPVEEVIPEEVSADSQGGGEVIVDPLPAENAEDAGEEQVPETPAPEETPVSETDGTPDVSETGNADEQGVSVPEEDVQNKEDQTQEENEDADPQEMPAFEEAVMMDTVRIEVKAPEGAFPADAMLSVEIIPEEKQAEADKAVVEVRPAGQNAAVSYTYDIKVLNAAGQELQPAEGQTVEVSFALPQAADHNLSANVYHITNNETTGELTAERLQAVVDELEGTVKAETTGFSLYTVEFTYNDLEYVLQEGASAALSGILAAVGLTGEAEAVSVSNEQLISASNESGEWVISALQAIETEEWIQVTIRGIVYEIAVSGEAGGASANIEVSGVSLTKNIVGDVFVNTLNASEEVKDTSLINYPLDPHDDVSDYGDSPRVRYLEGGDEEGPNYLVYRDSYLLISQEDSANYSVTSSGDGLTAYITPALSVEQVQGKTGVVFLAEDVTFDNILVFDGEPTVDGDTMTVSLKRTEDILANEVFSDGKLAPEQEAAPQKPMLRAGAPSINWKTEPKGTNWSGEITSFKPSWPTPRYKLNIWDLLFELGLNLTIDMDFHITTKGSSYKTEEVKIASVEIPVKTIFALSMDYSLVVRFDDTPIDVEGTLNTNFNIDIGTEGASVNNYRNQLKIKKLKVDPKNDHPDSQYCNKNVDFYIGSKLSADAKVLYIKINLLIKTVELGPVLKLKIVAEGGGDIKARHERDEYPALVDLTGRDSIHTCTETGKDGCLDIQVNEKNHTYIELTLDLYFGRWSFDPYDPGPTSLGVTNYYKSETYDRRDSDVHEGICPHRLYKVPVAVWQGYDGSNYSNPANNMKVSVNDDLTKLITSDEIETFATGKTNENGRTDLFLPWYNSRRYTVVANGKIDTGESEISVSGSKQMDSGMEMGRNDQVNIVLDADKEFYLTVNIDWIADEQKLDTLGGSPAYEQLQIQRRAGEAGEWKDVARMAVEKSGNWTGTYDDKLPKYEVVDGKAVLYEYRVLALKDPASPDLPSDRFIIQEGEYNTYGHESYIDYVGEVEPEGTTKYLFHYAEPVKNGDTYFFTITQTAVMDITLNKRWLLSDPADEIPESVYLALLQKPYSGWEDKAAEKGVPTEWVAALDPLKGEANSFRSLEDAEVIYIIEDISSIENRPLAIGEVREDNNWSVTYTVPKYRNGVKLMWQGAELDSTVISGVLANEYDLNIPLSVISFGDYITVPGAANAGYHNYERTATVFNSTYDSHTIAGTVRWQAYGTGYDTLDNDLEVKIHVLKDGEEIKESKSNPIILKAVDHPEQATWIWTLTGDGIDSSGDYTVVEEFLAPKGAEKNWLCETNGLDAYNYRVNPDRAMFILMHATFEDGIDQDNLKYADGTSVQTPDEMPWLKVRLFNGSTELFDGNNNTIYLHHDAGKVNDWFKRISQEDSQRGDITDYIYKAPELEGLIPVYEKPIAMMWGTQLAYSFTVHYIPETPLTLQVMKQWENMDVTAKTSGAYPEEVAYKVYRDSELIAEGTLEQDGEWSPEVTDESDDDDDSAGGEDEEPAPPAKPVWTSVTITKDNKDGLLYRYWKDENNEYHKYTYTVIETPVEGFTSAVTQTDNVTDSENKATFTLTNTWVGPDYVHAKGEVFWEGDEGKEYLRPDTVKLSVVNSKEEYIRTIEVPIKTEESDEDDDEEEKRFTWEAKYLPGRDKDGNILRYSVLESHVKGYTTTYSDSYFDEEAGKWSNYDEETRTWTCDVTNKLTGYFPLTIKKVIEGEPGTEEEYTFTVENKENEDGTDREIPLPVNKDELKIKSSDKTKEVIAEFLLDEDGLYLYSVKEIKGSDEECTYDDSEKLVLISRHTELNLETREIEVVFDSWVADAGDDSTDEDATVDGNPVDETPGEGGDDSDPESGAQPDYEESNTVEFVNVYPNEVVISGTKIWNDDEDQDGIRPEKVQVQLLADGEPVTIQVPVKENADEDDNNEDENGEDGDNENGDNENGNEPDGQETDEEEEEVTYQEVPLIMDVSANGNWKYIFPKQPRNKTVTNEETGKEEEVEIRYSVREVVPEDEKVITGVDGEGTYAISYETKHKEDGEDDWICNVINTHTTKKITVEKKWVDREGKESDEWKPESVKVVLQHKKGAESTDAETGDDTESGDGTDTGDGTEAGNDGGTGETPSTDTETWETVGEPVELSEANEWKAEFQAKGLTESAVANGEWRIRELDPDGKVIYAKDDEDRPEDAKNEIVLNVKKGDKNNDVPYVVSYEVTKQSEEDNEGDNTGDSTGDDTGDNTEETGDSTGANDHTIITNKLNGKQITVEKNWDIDLEKNDKPESIEAVIQEKKDDKWETVALLELNGDNSWKESRFLPTERDGKEIEYRARELRQETALEEIIKNLKKTISAAATGSYDEIIGQIKSSAGDYYNMLPDGIKNAVDKGSDKLKDELKTTTENIYDKLLEKIGIAASENRIVYDKDDSDKKTDDDKKDEDKSGDDQSSGEDGEDSKKDETKKKETNAVTYYVKESSVIPGMEGGTEAKGHNTKYRVKYEKDGDTFKITNKAILEIDVIKRWIGLGVDDEDMPDSAWVVLMFNLAVEKNDPKIKQAASAAGVDPGILTDYEIPVFNLGALGEETPFLLEDGQDPLSIISQLTIGIDLDIFSGILPKMAIARVTKDNNWRVHYVVSKYALGLPVEFKGAELGSEVIRQIIKYVTGGILNPPVSYNPFDNFFSIPTPAIRTLAGIEDPKDFLDLSKLTGKFLEKAKSLTMDEIKNFGPETLLDDSQLMANVINVKIDWDTSQDHILTKEWVGDKEEDRPDGIKVILKDELAENPEEEITVTLEKENFEGKDTWVYDLSELDEDEDDTDNSEDDKDKDKKKPEHSYKIVDEKYLTKDGEEYKETENSNYDCKVDGLTITNTWKDPEKVNISGRKIWEDDDDKDGIRPEKITVKLLADGKEIKSVETSKEGGWKYHFTDLPKYKDASKDEDAEDGGNDSGNDESGKAEIVYTIKEEEVEGYKLAEGSGTKDSGYNLTNTHEPGTITIEGKKVWNDAENQDGKRPESIKIRLKADGEEVDSVEVREGDEDGEWTFTFEDQPKTNGGKDIVYTITEDTVEDYTTKIEGDAEEGFTVTNTYEPGKTQVQVTKVWNDDDDRDGIRPNSVTIALLADGEPAEDEEGKPLTLVLSEENSWTGSFKDLDEMKEGNKIAYTVEEEKTEVITGEDGEGTYASKVSGNAGKGFTVTNTHTPQTIRIEVTKVWDDKNDQDGKRPDSVAVNLMSRTEDGGLEPVEDENGVARTLVLSEENDWENVFDGLDKDKDGEPVKYVVEEQKTDVITGVDGPGTYAFAVKESRATDEGFHVTVTNTHTPERIMVEGVKVWDDEDNQDGKRPEGITIRLWNDSNEEVASKEVTEADGWEWIFEGLPKYAGGKEIVYTLSEDTVKDYISEIEGDAKTGFTVTNTHTPAKTEVTVEKEWQDMNDFDGIRPKEVEVKLLAESKETGKSIKLSAENDWKGSFTDLDEKAGGSTIRYTVAEVTDEVITGKDTENTYAFKVTGSGNHYKITNTHTPIGEIVYELNGGTWKGSPDDIVEKHPIGTKITIHEKPVRNGYTFLFWKGSEYQPGEEYTVAEKKHVFVAQWDPVVTPTPTVTPIPTVTPKPTVTPVPGITIIPGNSTRITEGAKTGDENRVGMWLALLVLGVAGLAAGTAVRKKRRR